MNNFSKSNLLFFLSLFFCLCKSHFLYLKKTHFLVECTQFYKLLCWLVGPSIGQSVGRSLFTKRATYGDQPCLLMRISLFIKTVQTHLFVGRLATSSHHHHSARTALTFCSVSSPSLSRSWFAARGHALIPDWTSRVERHRPGPRNDWNIRNEI